MLKKVLTRVFLATVVVIMFVLLVGYLRFKHDPFFAYRAPLKKVESESLKHFQAVDEVIKNALSLELSPRERAIILGMRFVIRFADKDVNFKFIFPSYLLLLHEMTSSEDRKYQREIAQMAVRASLLRAQKILPELYLKNESGRWQLIGILHILLKYPEYKTSFFDFFRERFGNYPATYTQNEGISFSTAIKTRRYKILGDYLINSSFLHYYLAKINEPELVLPQDLFPRYLREFEQFDYDVTHPISDNQFIDSGFLATHVVLILTNYGEFAIKDDSNMRKAQAYLEATLNQVQHDLGYLDLLAEYVQCLKILNPGKDPRILDLEKLLLGLQRPDGSWSSWQDFKSNPYDAFHPTWSVLTAINHPNK